MDAKTPSLRPPGHHHFFIFFQHQFISIFICGGVSHACCSPSDEKQDLDSRVKSVTGSLADEGTIDPSEISDVDDGESVSETVVHFQQDIDIEKCVRKVDEIIALYRRGKLVLTSRRHFDRSDRTYWSFYRSWNWFR